MRSDFGKRLFDARTNAKLTQHQLAKAVGISQGTLGELEQKGQGSAHAAGLANACGVSIDWLVYGTGEMLPTARSVDVPYSPEKNFPPPAVQEKTRWGLSGINQQNVKRAWVVGKGAGGLMPEKIWSDGDYPVGATDDYAEVASVDPHCFLTKVVGQSMVPRFNPDEYALVEPGTMPEIEDDVLVRLSDGQTLLKKLLSRRGGVKLGSYNETATHFFETNEIVWMYYVAHPVPARKIKSRSGGDQTIYLDW